MFKESKIIKKVLLSVFVVSIVSGGSVAMAAEGDYGVAISPPNESIILNAGDVYAGSFNVSNPVSNPMDFNYVVSVEPFYVDENYNIYYGDAASYNQITDWIKVETRSGVVKPNDSDTINFTINVPNDAPAGGQYAAIIVKSESPISDGDGGELGLQINQAIGMAHIIYAEISGTTERRGEISNVNVQSFLISGDIIGSSTIKNTGNVHGTAKYTLQVFPLFSNEEIYTNEESPNTMSILPDRYYYSETIWEDTPVAGIFNVVYTVEFEGVTAQVKKLVIKCPIWLLFIIVFAIAAIIIYFVARAKARKSPRKAETE